MAISACTFIKNNVQGAFCLFESMASIIPLVDEYVVFDLGSTDGTREELRKLAEANKKIKICSSHWSKIDAGAFADIANTCIQECANDTVIFHQADEIFHENLVDLTRTAIAEGKTELSFWRYKLMNT